MECMEFQQHGTSCLNATLHTPMPNFIGVENLDLRQLFDVIKDGVSCDECNWRNLRAGTHLRHTCVLRCCWRQAFLHDLYVTMMIRPVKVTGTVLTKPQNCLLRRLITC